MEQRAGRSDPGRLCVSTSCLFYPESSILCSDCSCAVVLSMEHSWWCTKKCQGKQVVPKGVFVITLLACSTGMKDNSAGLVLPGLCSYSGAVTLLPHIWISQRQMPQDWHFCSCSRVEQVSCSVEKCSYLNCAVSCRL